MTLIQKFLMMILHLLDMDGDGIPDEPKAKVEPRRRFS